MTKKQKIDSVQKRDGKHWSFLHPTTQQWTGSFKSRVVARAARSAAISGTPFGDAAVSDASDVEKDATEKVVDNSSTLPVDSLSREPTTSGSMSSVVNISSSKDSITMAQITLVKSDKVRKSTSVVYTALNGLRGSVRFAKTLFAGDAPGTIVIDSDAFATAKPKLTAEERKAQRKNAPKLTPAQKLAKLQERAAKLQAKIDAQNAAPAEVAAQ